ncbi:hypothetical protein ACFTAO_12225 [Paenibacillus rhizoplanae]
MFERNRSKAVELLARFKDHATGAYYKGFRMLTLGWSDGHTFLPLDFALLSSVKAGLTGIHPGIDKRSSGYKRRKESLLSAPASGFRTAGSGHRLGCFCDLRTHG